MQCATLGTGNKNGEMKQVVISSLVFLCLSFVSNAQYDSKGDSIRSRFRPGAMWYFTGWRPAKLERVRKYDRLIFDIAYNDWIGDKDLFKNHWASIGFNTNFMADIPLTKGNTVSIGVGLAHSYSVIRHNGHLIGNDSTGITTWSPKLPTDNFRKSIFGGHSFSIPLELRFHKESWKHFKLHLGGKIGYQTSLYSKYVTNNWLDREVSKNYNFPDQNNLIYSAHVRLGFRNWALFGSYNFNKIFSDPSSVQLNHVQMGLSISLF